MIITLFTTKVKNQRNYVNISENACMCKWQVAIIDYGKQLGGKRWKLGCKSHLNGTIPLTGVEKRWCRLFGLSLVFMDLVLHYLSLFAFVPSKYLVELFFFSKIWIRCILQMKKKTDIDETKKTLKNWKWRKKLITLERKRNALF